MRAAFPGRAVPSSPRGGAMTVLGPGLGGAPLSP